MSHKITKHHQVRTERKHQNLETHREKKDQERLRLGNLLLHEGEFDRNRQAFLDSKKQNKFIQKAKADEKVEAKTGRVKNKNQPSE